MSSRQFRHVKRKPLEGTTHCERFGGRRCSVLHARGTKVDVTQREETQKEGKKKMFFPVLCGFAFFESRKLKRAHHQYYEANQHRTTFIIILQSRAFQQPSKRPYPNESSRIAKDLKSRTS